MRNNKQATFLQVVDDYKQVYDLHAPLGVLAKANIIMALKKPIKNHPNLHTILLQLKRCDTLNQMINVLGEHTDYLTQLRTPEEIAQLNKNIVRMVRVAQLPRL